MGSRTATPPAEPSSPSENGIRKRVCKACDRCRLKKSKCDGSTPCSRCRADNAICVFGERKKSQDKVYPKGYVEMLEHQHTQLVNGLQELYRRLQTGETWTGAPLKESVRGIPLTHDILERLGALKQENQAAVDNFEEDLDALQSRMSTNGAGVPQRGYSGDTNSEVDQSPTFEPVFHQKLPAFTNPFTTNQFPPTPPNRSPHPSLVKTSSPLKSHIMHTTPQITSHNQWQLEPAELDTMDFNMPYNAPLFDHNMQEVAFTPQIFHDPAGMAINPCLTMKDWQVSEDQNPQYFRNGLYT